MWTMIDVWVVVVGALCAMSCALLGNFLVLRRMSMMGDAISHAVLPGIAIAFMVTHSRGGLVMFAGAVVVGILTALLTQWVHRLGKVEESAAMGVVFTSLFALGLILISQVKSVDLDVDCVLHGILETVAMDTTRVAGMEIPRAAISTGIVFVVNIVFVVALYKELKISSFDPDLATTLGINGNLMHYLLMAMVATTTVASFESVGSILVIAMMIVPPATAYLLTRRLSVMIGLSVAIALFSAVAGHWSAVSIPRWFGLKATITSSMMAVMSGLCFALAAAGQIARSLSQRRRLQTRILREDILGVLFRLDELAKTDEVEDVPAFAQDMLQVGVRRVRSVMGRLAREGLIKGTQLTEAGRQSATKIIRSHRLWEAYLQKYFNLPADHLHAPASTLEHVSLSDMESRLAEAVDNPDHDPHNQPIPPTGPASAG